MVFFVPLLPSLLCAVHSRSAAPRTCFASLRLVLRLAFPAHVSCTVLQLPGEQVCPSAVSQSFSYMSTRSWYGGSWRRLSGKKKNFVPLSFKNLETSEEKSQLIKLKVCDEDFRKNNPSESLRFLPGPFS